MLNSAVVIANPDAISHFCRLAQLGACRLELQGLRHSNGRSTIAMVKKKYGFKGNREKVVSQFAALLEKERNF